MNTTVILSTLGLILSFQSAPPKPAAATLVPSDSEIRSILVERIDKQKQSVGIVVGVIEASGRRTVAYGRLAKDDKRSVDGDTVFEIGSVTKAFTSLLLADMVQRGEVALNDPISKYLPAEVKVPERSGRVITLEDLSTHTSGLPRMPGNFSPKDAGNPYADYTADQLFQFLSTYQLTRDIGSKFEYSNLGGGLLGQVLTRRAGVDYETLVRTRIAGPLGMTRTGIALSPEMKAHLAVGHNSGLVAVPNWDIPALAGAGALRSTANDLLAFLAANLGYKESPLAPAMGAMIKTRRPAPPLGEIGLGWLIKKAQDDEIIWHNGGTGGYRSFVGYRVKARAGVVVLSNTSTATGVDDIGMHLLDSSAPLIPPPKEHKELAVDSRLFEGYVGQYQLAPNFILTITREGDSLYAQATNQPKFQIFPETKKDFFFKVVDAQITFETDSEGRANALVLHQNGRDLRAKRTD